MKPMIVALAAERGQTMKTIRKLTITILVALAAAACTAAPPPLEYEDMGPDRDTMEYDAACQTHPTVNDCAEEEKSS